MSFKQWIEYIGRAKKISYITNTCRKIHYKFDDGCEMTEEYNIETGVIIHRAWKKQNHILIANKHTGNSNEMTFGWETELGDNFLQTRVPEVEIIEAKATPVLSKRITRKNIEWRIRNLPYPIDNYVVSTDVMKNVIVVRTINKKYYKEVPVPELDRCNLRLDSSAISVAHRQNTLILYYEKPELLNEMERVIVEMLQNLHTKNSDEFIRSSKIQML